MLFHSYAFILFFLIFLPLFFYAKKSLRLLLIVIFSYYFYTYKHPWWYILLLLASTLIDFFLAQSIEKEKRKYKLWLSLFVNFAILFIFKYYNFFALEFHWSTSLIPMDAAIPLGISFYTFQTVGYTIDVYRGGIKSEKNFLLFASYVSFFPQLVAGPIERANKLIPQLAKKTYFSYQNMREGLLLFIIGLVEKLIIADRLSYFGHALYREHLMLTPLQIWFSLYLIFISIYCDFSGYIHMAQGIARILDIKLSENFLSPLLSKSPIEFWSRWHMTLMRWFNDYIYIPIVFTDLKYSTRLLAVLIVFLASGIWHGADAHFIVWGLLSGLSVLLTYVIRKSLPQLSQYKNRIYDLFLIILNFHITVFIGVFIVETTSFNINISVIKSLFMNHNQGSNSFFQLLPLHEFYLILVLTTVVFLSEYLLLSQSHVSRILKQKTAVRWSIYFGFSFALLFLAFSQVKLNSFIYFHF